MTVLDTPGHRWILRLYIAGKTPKSVSALNNLKALCEGPLAGDCQLEIIDLTVTPERAKLDQIVAIPTLVRHLPAPIKRIIGDLSNQTHVLAGLDLEISDS